MEGLVRRLFWVLWIPPLSLSLSLSLKRLTTAQYDTLNAVNAVNAVLFASPDQAEID
jgi:hypothetical protein